MKIFNKKIASLALSLSAMAFASSALANEDVKAGIVEAQPQFEGAEINVNRELSNYGLDGFYEVNVQGQDLIITPNYRYAILGDLFDLQEMRNISEETRNSQRGEVAERVISGLDKDGMVIVDLADGVEHIGDMYVFTDPTCPYCHRVHAEIEEYQEAGVKVHYIPYPRSGVSNNGRDFQQLSNILCADDQVAAMTAYKESGDTSAYDGQGEACEDQVAAGYRAGQQIGVSGTPFIYLSTGDAIPGYNPASQIIQRFQNN